MKILQIITFLFFFIIPTGYANPYDYLSAQTAILIDANTGNVIYEKNANKKMYPASTTKMMTAILALENGNPNDIVSIDKNAAGVEGSSMELEIGDKVYLKDLMYGLLLPSGNDAAVAIATQVSGSVKSFADRMNEKAKMLGAKNTHFVNSNGLPDPNHYSTAADLAKIASYAYKKQTFRKIVSTKSLTIKWVSPQKSKLFKNTNRLLSEYSDATGIKTGSTIAAGECLIASAERNGVKLIAVLMHVDKGQRFTEAAKLLDYGFEQTKLLDCEFERVTLPVASAKTSLENVVLCP